MGTKGKLLHTAVQEVLVSLNDAMEVFQ